LPDDDLVTTDWPDADRFPVNAAGKRDHWISNGISVRSCGAITDCLKKIDDETLASRVMPANSRPLHAKIYLADRAATLGSSNFTQNGLAAQFEANARFLKDREPKRYRELATIAENYWAAGASGWHLLIDLIRQRLPRCGASV
jgi:phosphatidylserine/phosphatidylglycerophosphate/cardiolipin synthase-like enzyme